MTSRYRTLLAALALTALAGIIAACGGGSDETTTDAAAGPTKITFSYFWPEVDFMMVPIVAAQEEGYFEEAGLEVEVLFPPDPASAAKLLGTDEAQLGIVTTTDIASSVEAEVPIKAIGNYTMSNNWGLFTKPGTPISIDSLAGKRIAGYGDTWTNAMLPFVLENAGLKEGDVEVVTVDWDLPLLLSGEVDVTTNTTNYIRPGVVDETGEEPETLLARDHGAPDVPIWVFAGNETFLAEQPDAVRAFLGAVMKGLEWAEQNPEAASAAFELAYPDHGYTTTYNTAGWNDTVDYLRNQDGEMLVQTDEQWTALADALVGIGALESAASPGDYYTNDFIPE